MKKQKVLFICKDGAVRSQLAAAFLNAYFGERYEAYCAGTEPRELNPCADKVMKEIGIDISFCPVTKIEGLRQNEFDCIITLCDFAKAHLSTLPEYKKQLHKSFKDFCTQKFCENAGKSRRCFPVEKKLMLKSSYDTKESEEDILTGFRYLREAIFNWVEHEMVF